ncbi:MAG: beta-ketoacyl-ACP synthase [Pseudopedobacter saltans]|uniref:3-oxoacyl-[acyl-carrier-protein] synthase 1 n=1 Tax=Pseudopedobacter saltans TaxID=151895 RepID=A0A2W5F8U2_9SPHI|nr:MAG: beta-ketoacyl-ACP synthase [Pseudopedobacter saltans]
MGKKKANRVVITGMGVVSPNGVGKKQFMAALRKGKSGIAFQPELEQLGYRCQVAGVPPLKGAAIREFLARFQMEEVISSGIIYGCMAAVEAWEDAGLPINTNSSDPDIDSSCIFGTGSNGAEATIYQIEHAESAMGEKLNPSIPLQSLNNAVSIYIAYMLGLGGQVTSNASACSTGTEGLMMAYDKIRYRNEKRILVGSSESKGAFVWSPFDAMFATAQDHNKHPEKASCPLGESATGFVPGAGGGALVVESLDSALERGAHIYAEIIGGHINSGGQRGDGSMTIGNVHGMIRCIQMAMISAGIKPEEIDLISGHLTSTIGDIIEIRSWISATGLMGDAFPYINSTKSMIGHSLSASGSIESIASIMQLENNFIHPSLNAHPLHQDIAPYIAAEKIPSKPILNHNLDIVAKLSLGFGDVNTCIFFKKWKG